MMHKEKIFIFGGSNLAKLTIDIIEKEGKYLIAGILDSSKQPGDRIAGYDILGPIKNLPKFSQKYTTAKGIIAIGDNYTRNKVAQQIKQLLPAFEFVATMHPSVILGSRVRIGSGCILSAGVVINNDCKMGEHCYLALQSGISHDSEIGKFSSLGPGAIVAGDVRIGECTTICLGAKVLNGREIGSNSVVGAASLVYHDVEDGVVVIGIPAKIVRKREKDELYL